MKRYWMILLTAVTVGAWPTARAVAEEPSGWASKMSFKGDLRLREEFIDEEGKDKERWRMRLRARLALKAKVNDTLDVHIRLSSGGDDPASRNQSLGLGFSTKDFNLGRAYFDWHPDVTPGLMLGLSSSQSPWLGVYPSPSMSTSPGHWALLPSQSWSMKSRQISSAPG